MPDPARRAAPTATYRVQLTPEHGFRALAGLADHLSRLGVSHAYVSPILASAPGSQHGYDVIDHTLIDEDLGGATGFSEAAAALRSRGIALVVDVVPNHMAVPAPEYLNPVLWSVLRDGSRSPCARWLDVDWQRDQPLLLPVLTQRLAAVLDDGELTRDRIVLDSAAQAVLRYHDHVFPLRAGTEDLPLEAALGRQHYRLAYWRSGTEELNYRRFFDVDSLMGIRIEDSTVFAESHAIHVQLVREGTVDGLRIDHPDGLADPQSYLHRLHRATDGAWLVVEKILQADERLPRSWACAGTTGYDALAVITELMADAPGLRRLRVQHARVADVRETWEHAQQDARRDVLATLLVTEVDRLAAVAYDACQDDLRLRDFTRRGLHDAITELLVAMPVYRAYVRPGEPAGLEARHVLDAARAGARLSRPDRADEIDLVHGLALGSRHGRSADDFVVRFQQTCGPTLAKGVEDTAGFRWSPLLALAEVGCGPMPRGRTSMDAHAWAYQQHAECPEGMTTLSTHDTKRSEDVRARLMLLTEIPDEWAATVRRWRSAHGRLDDPRAEWHVWQTLVGSAGIDGRPLPQWRLAPSVVKSLREMKLRTSWMEPDEKYEGRVLEWLDGVLSDPSWQAQLGRLVDRLHPGFASNVLSGKAWQLLLPGVPDVYGGCETVSLRLGDPDNRFPEPRAGLTEVLDRGLRGPVDPRTDLPAAKARLVARVLGLRRSCPDLVGAGAAGAYEPLAVRGAAGLHLHAFLRGGAIAVAGTRLPLRLASSGGWRDTVIDLPDGPWVNILTGTAVHGGAGTPVPALLDSWPAAVLVRG